jgi:molybdenum cofactor synthesis domain-containing protein
MPGRDLTSQRAYSNDAHAETTAVRKAAMMVIGDEILSGSVQDSNTPWLAKFLRARGVDLVRVEFVPDSYEDIADSLHRLRSKVSEEGFVFTSGGIGPTHDDITYDAIAKALGLKLELHEETHERMKVHYKERGIELNESRLRMAQLPTPCRVLPPNDNIWVPLCCVGNNVYILPGIPRLFTAMIENHADVFKGPGEIYTRELFSQMGEGDFGEALRKVAGESKFRNVRVGSYPNTKWSMSPDADNDGLEYRVKIVVEGRNKEEVAAASDEIAQII